MTRALPLTMIAVAVMSAQSDAATPVPALLAALRADDVDPYPKDLPGGNLGDGGEFSVGAKRYLRVEGRHVTFRTAAGVKRCVISQTEATAWTFGNAGAIVCGTVRLRKAINPRVRSDLGQPVVLTIADGSKSSTLSGLWQGLD